MKLGIALSTLALVALPTFGFAMCTSEQHAMSCAEGTVYDAETATCVIATTS
ncbi:MAG: carbohydrate-binding module family 14 protein [Sulfitobacter sp.]|jgi:hypothetical protein|nr:carbohydrate-binding module family 14 protein [Sulfitobacter sp.]